MKNSFVYSPSELDLGGSVGNFSDSSALTLSNIYLTVYYFVSVGLFASSVSEPAEVFKQYTKAATEMPTIWE